MIEMDGSVEIRGHSAFLRMIKENSKSNYMARIPIRLKVSTAVRAPPFPGSGTGNQFFEFRRY